MLSDMGIHTRALGPFGGLALAVSAGCAPGASGAAETASSASSETAATHARATPHPHGRWARILRRLDLRRGDAFVRGDPSILGRVYVRDSRVLRADARLLRAYRRRGLELDAVRLRLRSVEFVRRGDSQVDLRVVDRLARVRVRAGDGPWHELPRDRPTERVVTLRRVRDGWRIAGVRRVAG